MERRVNRITRKVGLLPGTLVHVGLQKSHTVKVTVIDYDAAGRYEEWQPEDLEEVVSLKTSRTVSWINVDGIHEVHVVERIGALFGIHPLIAPLGLRDGLLQAEEMVVTVLQRSGACAPIIGDREPKTARPRSETL